ncbi:hypothetical protein PQO01_09360 [Lentisphaera marina]|uniref:hypothetical protein n=1 Tax=Lentisphaera marina TaxID=1111041 RepID=UPI0023654493|nr:hypothetical protein [Lentisphaera marina]MDD7985156.1 hypothetical protein [Lentisphaera marina]
MKKLITTLVISMACSLFADESGAGKKPNILFFYADDWGKMASCYTDDSVFGKMNETFQTPTIDRLANEGARFRNAF